MLRHITVVLFFISTQAHGQQSGWQVLAPPEAAKAGDPLPDWATPIQESLQNDDSLEVLIEFRAPLDETTSKDVERAQTGERTASETYAANVRSSVAVARAPFVTELGTVGIEIIKSYIYQPVIHARITPKHFDYLVTNPAIVGVYLNTEQKVEDSEVSEDIERPKLYLTTIQTGASKTWAQGFRGPGYTVAILDNGIIATHEMLKNKIIAEGCFSTATTGSQSLCPGGVSATSGPGTASLCTGGNSICDHGSHVAGIAAGNNGSATTLKQGIAPDAKIIATQVFRRVNSTITCDGALSCLVSSSADQLAALDWLIAVGPTYKLVAINLSLGTSVGYASYCDTGEVRVRAIKTLRAMGVLTVIAAGNEGYTGRVSSPGCIKKAVTVSSTVIANNAPNTSHNHASIVDLLAPGTSIESATATSTTSYGFKSGTSMATPHVTGAFAVLKSKLATATADQLEYALKASGTAITSSSWTWSTPRIEIDKALDVVGREPPPEGTALPGFVPGAYPGGSAYLRLINPTSSTGTVTVTLVQDTPRKILGALDISVPARAAIQKEIREIETILGQAGDKDSGLSIYLDADFSGFAQNVRWSTTSRALTNLTVCKAATADPNNFLGNAHTSRIDTGNTSIIQIHNQGTTTTNAVFDIYNASNGAFIGLLGTQTIEPNTSLALPAQAALNALRFVPGESDIHVNFALRSGFTGTIGHIVHNIEAGLLTDMTAKCPI